MKNVRVRVVNSCSGNYWYIAVCEENRRLLKTMNFTWYSRKAIAIKYAKKIAKRIGIKYDPEIIKMHDC